MLVALNLVLFEVNSAFMRNLAVEHLYGSSNHWVPCSQWPTTEEVDHVIDENLDVVNRIEAATPGLVSVWVNTTESCPGKAELRIFVSGVREKDAIREIIGDDTHFVGVPYRISNI